MVAFGIHGLISSPATAVRFSTAGKTPIRSPLAPYTSELFAWRTGRSALRSQLEPK